MKIEKSNSSLPPSAASESAARVAQAKTSQSQPAPEGVNVSLSSTNSQLRSMEASMADAPTVDSKRVAELKLAISEGRFQINSGAIADGLINNVEDMISASQS
ncbi:MAG: flagellar biosynthesis anti-sigma factor FlgM [Gallionellaceae bacterium]